MSIMDRINQAKENKNSDEKNAVINKLVQQYENEAIRFTGSMTETLRQGINEYRNILSNMSLSELKARL